MMMMVTIIKTTILFSPTTSQLHSSQWRRRSPNRVVFSTERRRGRDQREHVLEAIPPSLCGCCVGGRRQLLVGLGSPFIAGGFLKPYESDASVEHSGSDLSVLSDVSFGRSPRAAWFEEFYAVAMENGMKSYEKEVATYKKELFRQLRGDNKKVLEVGIGTGPNLILYANTPGTYVYGVDPNKQMEKYAREAAVLSGLPSPNFNFILGVAEALPIKDNTMDVVIGTLVLCSVDDIYASLREIKRVLKPGGTYIFMEHVAASEGTFLKIAQTILDALQQCVADGCHMARETGKAISEAGFSDLQMSSISIPNVFILSPHVYGIAWK